MKIMHETRFYSDSVKPVDGLKSDGELKQDKVLAAAWQGSLHFSQPFILESSFLQPRAIACDRASEKRNTKRKKIVGGNTACQELVKKYADLLGCII